MLTLNTFLCYYVFNKTNGGKYLWLIEKEIEITL